MSLEKFTTFICKDFWIVSQKIYFIFFPLKNLLFLWEFLVFLSHHTFCFNNVIFLKFNFFLFWLLFVWWFHDFALEFSSIKNFWWLSNNWKMFGKNLMSSDFLKGDTIVNIHIEYFIEKVIHVRSTVFNFLFLCTLNSSWKDKLWCHLFEFNFFSFWLPMGIQLWIEEKLLKGNSMLSIK